jgi:serine/threonine protein kinase
MEEFDSSIPGYEILGELGRGGMGIVFKAHNLRYNRPVALKMILSGHGANLLELARFRIEAEAIASLAHPNIVRIHEVGVHLGYPFFVLEYAEGGSLAGRIRAQATPSDWTPHVIRQLALAMQHVHKRGIIHRDLKPANVLLMSDDVPKVTDFGLAKFTTGDESLDDPRSGMTITIPEVFTKLTRMHREYEYIKKSANHAAGTTFEDYVIREEWKQRIRWPRIEDEPRVDDMRMFVEEALRQASLHIPTESQARENLTRSRSIMGTPHYYVSRTSLGSD